MKQRLLKILSIAVLSVSLFACTPAKPKAVDTSDTSIKLIATYSDYLEMYEGIINSYLNKYEEAIKGTLLENQENFDQLKTSLQQSFEEQKKNFDSIKDTSIVGKDAIVDFLITFRNGLDESLDALKKELAN